MDFTVHLPSVFIVFFLFLFILSSIPSSKICCIYLSHYSLVLSLWVHIYTYELVFLYINQELSSSCLGIHAHVFLDSLVWLLLKEKRKKLISVYVSNLCYGFDSRIRFIYLIYTSSYDWVEASISFLSMTCFCNSYIVGIPRSLHSLS